jgi:hypothetical protein
MIFGPGQSATGSAVGENDGNKTQAPQGGDFMSAVQDDQPIAVEGASVSIRVNEDFHHRGWFHFGFGRFDNTRFTRAQLQDLVDAGTDGPALFTLDTSISGPVKTTDGTLVTSQGVQVSFAAVGHRIIGFADTDGDGSRDLGEHTVFRLVDKGSRGFDFDLKGEVDHPASSGGSGAEVLSLDLTDAFSATDSDGDPVTLATNSIVVELGETNGDDGGPHEHGPDGHGPDGHGQDGPEGDRCGPDEPGQHEEGPNQDSFDFLSQLTGLAGEGGHQIFDALADRLTGDSADGSSHSQTENDVLADLAGHDAFFFNNEFGAAVATHLLAAAGELFDFFDELAVNVPPLREALTELEGRFETIANALEEFLAKNAPPAAHHQDNFVL